MATVVERSTETNLAHEPHRSRLPHGSGSEQPEPTAEFASAGERAVMLIAVLGPLFGCIIAIAITWMMGLMGWLYLGMLLGGSLLTLLGITVSYHRLLAHKSFDTVTPVRALFTALGAMAVEGSPMRWAAVHRRHHQYSDEVGDPHSPHLHEGGVWNTIKGLWYAHTGWLFTKYWAKADIERYVPDLARDPVSANISNYYYIFVLLSLGIPAAIGGLATMSLTGAALGLLWGGLVRIFLSHHITWSINSICHVFGTRDFETTDHSTNNVVCAILGVGEGWHNNHHAYPTSAKFGFKWWQFDMGWVVIRTLQLCGLAWNVKVPSKAQRAAHAS